MNKKQEKFLDENLFNILTGRVPNIYKVIKNSGKSFYDLNSLDTTIGIPEYVIKSYAYMHKLLYNVKFGYPNNLLNARFGHVYSTDVNFNSSYTSIFPSNPYTYHYLTLDLFQLYNMRVNDASNQLGPYYVRYATDCPYEYANPNTNNPDVLLKIYNDKPEQPPILVSTHIPLYKISEITILKEKYKEHISYLEKLFPATKVTAGWTN